MQQVNFPKEIKAIIDEEIPNSLIKERSGGGSKKLRYISGSTVIDKLNIAFNRMWSWHLKKQWVQESVAKYNPKYDKEPVPQGPVAHVTGILTVYFKADDGSLIQVEKEASGSKAIMGGQSDQEHIFKAAGTDALKKAASLLGIGLQLFRDEEEQFYYESKTSSDNWNEETLEEFKDELQWIKDFQAKTNFGDTEMAYFYETFSGNKASNIEGIRPSKIKDFISFVDREAREAGVGA